MGIMRKKKKTPIGELRLDSTADVAFLLLIFFIVTASFIEEAGLVIDAIEPFQRRYEYESWTGRSRMTEAAKDELEQLILTAPDRILEAFAIDIDEGAIQSLDDNKLLLRARKSAS